MSWVKLVALCVISGIGAAAVHAARPQVGSSAAACAIFPPDNIWNVRVDGLPVDPNSAAYVNTIGAAENLHPDFGSGIWPPVTGGPIGIPFIEVGGNQAKVPIAFTDYESESDPGPYPVPSNAPIEGGAASDGDRHVIVLDTDNCRLYELFYAFPVNQGWEASSGAVYNLGSNALRPNGWTSADAAGLPIFPGLVRYDEVLAGSINHALRFTAPETRNVHIWPARHNASDLTGSEYPPMGQRFRLKANYDISGYSAEAQVILTALKQYGMILADNGSSWYLSGAPDERWDNDALNDLKDVPGSAFEAVTVSGLQVDPNSGQTTLGLTFDYAVHLPFVARP